MGAWKIWMSYTFSISVTCFWYTRCGLSCAFIVPSATSEDAETAEVYICMNRNRFIQSCLFDSIFYLDLRLASFAF